MHSAHPSLPFSVVAKPTGAACNLDCTYCFFLSKELLYQQKQQRMSESTLAKYLEKFFASHPDGPVILPWQGGEPTLRGIEFFETVVKIAKRYARPSQQIEHALQTNGTLINEKWANFLAKHNFLVGVSIDGPPKLHNAYRINKAGRATYQQVRRGWDLLQKYQVRTNILCTVHHANQAHPIEVYQHFRDDLGANFLQFIPIVERVDPAQISKAEAGWGTSTIDENTSREIENSKYQTKPNSTRLIYRQAGNAVTSRSVTPQAWGEFLCKIFDLWVQTDVGKVFVQHFDTALSAIFGLHTLCVHAPQCGNALAIEFNGDVYSCDHYVEPGYLLGNVNSADTFTQMLNNPIQKKFGHNKTLLPQTCEKCAVKQFCYGGCPKDRFLSGQAALKWAKETVSATEPALNYLCYGYKQFFTHAQTDLNIMANLLRAGKPAANIMKLKNKIK